MSIRGQCNTYQLSDMLVHYIIDEDTGNVGLNIIPSGCSDQLVPPRISFAGDPEIEELPEQFRPTQPRGVFSLAQVRCTGDVANEGPFGRTMLNGQTSQGFRLVSQAANQAALTASIDTVLESDNGLRCYHSLGHAKQSERITFQTRYENTSDRELTLELASSFCLSNLSPFDATASHDRLYLHRFRTHWSREGRHVVDSINQLQMSPSWHVAHSANERFGQVGSWSTTGWYPQMVLEDRVAGVFWAIRLAWSGSWQMELFRRDDQLSLVGGLADYDFGHWKKTLRSGESFAVPAAYLTTASGDLDGVCTRLIECAEERSRESKLPVTFNDWCTNWGDPSEASVRELVEPARQLGCDFYVVDAGWYKPDSGNWNQAHGDWNANQRMYPNGLKGTADLIRTHGMKPGIWFEFETVGVDSEVFQKTDWMLHCDGHPIQVGTRRFLDFRQQEVIEYLDEKVLKTLTEAGFAYLKLDYNSSIGKGADGADSLGEALREHLLCVGGYFRRLKEEVQDLVLEDCASGGMRLDPFTLALCDVGSFSDAHASPEIPIIAANLHRLVHPSKSLVWAVLRTGESTRRLHYSMAATLLGRPCLSGDIQQLNATQSEIVRGYIDLYRQSDQLLLHGRSRILGPVVDNYRQPRGFQIVVRESENQNEALLVCHSFNSCPDRERTLAIPSRLTRLCGQLAEGVALEVEEDTLVISFDQDWAGGVFHLSRE